VFVETEKDTVEFQLSSLDMLMFQFILLIGNWLTLSATQLMH